MGDLEGTVGQIGWGVLGEMTLTMNECHEKKIMDGGCNEIRCSGYAAMIHSKYPKTNSCRLKIFQEIKSPKIN